MFKSVGGDGTNRQLGEELADRAPGQGLKCHAIGVMGCKATFGCASSLVPENRHHLNQ
jgi:hypothetical protein